MFPNIPKEMGMAQCKIELDKRDGGLPTESVLELIELTLDYNISQFDGEWYRQTFGTAIGPHNACDYADIAMTFFDNLIQSHQNPWKILKLSILHFRKW